MFQCYFYPKLKLPNLPWYVNYPSQVSQHVRDSGYEKGLLDYDAPTAKGKSEEIGTVGRKELCERPGECWLMGGTGGK